MTKIVFCIFVYIDYTDTADIYSLYEYTVLALK